MKNYPPNQIRKSTIKIIKIHLAVFALAVRLNIQYQILNERSDETSLSFTFTLFLLPRNVSLKHRVTNCI